MQFQYDQLFFLVFRPKRQYIVTPPRLPLPLIFSNRFAILVFFSNFLKLIATYCKKVTKHWRGKGEKGIDVDKMYKQLKKNKKGRDEERVKHFISEHYKRMSMLLIILVLDTRGICFYGLSVIKFEEPEQKPWHLQKLERSRDVVTKNRTVTLQQVHDTLDNDYEQVSYRGARQTRKISSIKSKRNGTIHW